MRTGHTGSGRATILRLPRLSLIAAALLAVLLAAGAHSAHSSDPPTMRLDPAEIKDGGGPGFKMDVLIEGVTNLGGFEFEVHFDETRVNVAEVRTGPFLGSLGANVVCFSQLNPGVASYSCVADGVPPPGPSGSGVLASIDFTVKPSPAGKTELLLQACGAADPNGALIALNGCKDGSVTTNPTPGPPPVGGIAIDPDLSALGRRAEPAALQKLSLLPLLLGVGAGAVALASVAWYASRRLRGGLA